MLNESNYLLSLNRLEVCDLLLACTNIICASREEMLKDPDCPEYRREHVLPETIKKWQALHDKVERQLDRQDVLYFEA